MMKHTFTDTRELNSSTIYDICRNMLNVKKLQVIPFIENEYVWLISRDVLCILYGEINADKPHEIMDMPVYVDKRRVRSIILCKYNKWDIHLHNNELRYCRNDVEVTKKAFNSLYGISNIKSKIEKVIFNDPATIIFWNDGTKTVVKADDEPFDPEKGMAMAISKKVLGNEGNYYKVFKKWLPKENSSEYVDLPIFSEEDGFSRIEGGNHNE